MEAAKRCRIPAFGNWDYFDGIPISKCFDSTVHAGLIHGQYFREYASGDLLLVPAPTPVKPGRRIKVCITLVARSTIFCGSNQRERRGFNEKKKQRKVYDAKEERQFSPKNIVIRSSKAVDEDLYKIPPEFLSQKPKLKSLIGSMWTWCMCINCIM